MRAVNQQLVFLFKKRCGGNIKLKINTIQYPVVKNMEDRIAQDSFTITSKEKLNIPFVLTLEREMHIYNESLIKQPTDT